MDSRRRALFLLAGVLGLVLVVGAGSATAADADGPVDEQLVRDCAAGSPDDHAPPPEARTNAVTGWVDGYWYDEPIDVEASDGLSRTELERLSARTAARFEALRCLRFEAVPPVEVVARDEFANRTADTFDDVGQHDRLFDNAQFATLLLAGEDEDAIEVQENDRTTTVNGYYDFEAGHIAIVSDDDGSLSIDEPTLAHELGHALQDQQFNISRYDRRTTDQNNGVLGVIEGDVSYVEHRYRDRCEAGEWSDPCVTEGDGDSEGGAAAESEPPNWGLYFTRFQPYSDGPSFVAHVRDRGGWAAVNDLYDDMPDSARHVIDPDSYGEFEPRAVEIDDESGESFERLTDADGPNYDVVGQAGLSAIFMDTAYDDVPAAVVDPRQFLNLDDSGEVNESDPLEYDLAETDGWVGDRFYAYADGKNRTGSVWALEWTDADEAAEFAETYEELLEYRGGETVDAYGTTYVFDNETKFDMAVSLSVDDERVRIVTGPTVESLPEIHVSVEDDASADARGPGLGAGAAAAAIAIVALALLARR